MTGGWTPDKLYFYARFDDMKSAVEAQHAAVRDLIRTIPIRCCDLSWDKDFDTKKQVFGVTVRGFNVQPVDYL